ncbi:serine/threonine-protein kinase ht1 [Phtheirospermum japonicum]|uniref:Serine/threonine-protein kinase ht1 n=1 Tax=Phtheirospermum japonicum TaxID=374723 RepID=A0A830BR15_9LAMI|nr:serine/threonine-protein kinase ht1 [Phtheirospermum japonicum]
MDAKTSFIAVSRLKGRGNLSDKRFTGMSTGSISSKNMVVRADKIDLRNLDLQLEKQNFSRVWSKSTELQKPKEVWEIDPSKLEIRYFVARGTYGTVFRGTYDTQDVAVKLLDWGADDMETTQANAQRASFKQEVSVWHQLDHPNVTRNFLFRNRKKKLPFKTVIQLALDLSRGLSYLHSKKIVHRDVKAENMLLDTQRTLKIADFGVARVEAQNPADMTGETGTLGYMAPEVLDKMPYNRKCDVYSFGICLWEIYCCDLPYTDVSFAGVSSSVVKNNLRPSIPRCCPSSLANIMKRCWDANPDKRPEMDEVVKMLEAIDTSKGGGMIPEDQATGCFCFIPTRGP